MVLLELELPWDSQPQDAVQPRSDLTQLSALFQPLAEGYVRHLRRGSGSPLAAVTTINANGIAALNSAAGNTLSTNPNNLFSLNSGAILISFIRTSYTLVARWGPGISTGVVSTYLPFSDGKVYWDFGNSTENSGRLSVAGQSFAVGVRETWMFCAGARGREIWRDGRLIASNGGTATRASDATSNFLDAAWAGPGNPLNAGINVLATFDDMPSQAVCADLTSNYFNVFEPQRIDIPVAAAGGGGAFKPAWAIRNARTIGAGVI